MVPPPKKKKISKLLCGPCTSIKGVLARMGYQGGRGGLLGWSSNRMHYLFHRGNTLQLKRINFLPILDYDKTSLQLH